jgi:CheY-like chemotaxis protein
MAKEKINISLKTFALADDDSDDADLFAEALLEINPTIRFKKASNGRELLDKVESGEFGFPDIIFLDINMPEMNGWECLMALKKDSKLRSVPVVIYSTSSHVRDKAMAMKLGASYFYTKPDSYQQLKKFLALLISDPQVVIKN